MTRVARAIVLASLFAPAMLLAQTYDRPPPPAAPRDFTLPVPAVDTLPNGLRIVVVPRTSLPLVTVQLLVRSGAETDPPALAGLADVTAELLVKGTTTRTAPQIADAAEALGGALDSGAGWDRSQVSMTVTAPQVEAAVALIADVVRNPRFQQAELDRTRRQALDHLSVSLGEPGTVARMAADRVAFGTGAFGHSSGGTPESMKRIKRADVLAQHKTWYLPDNATLIFAGAIDAAQARALAQASFGTWTRPDAALPALVRDNATTTSPAPVAIAMDGAGQAGVVLVAPSIARDAPDYYAGVIANALLGGGYSSRLNQELRIRRGLTYGVGSSLDARRSAGVWRVSAQTKSESAAEFVEVMLAEIARVRDTEPAAAELEARKATVLGSVSRRFETTGGLVSVIAAYEATGIAPSAIGKSLPSLGAITSADVLAFARAHWDPARFAIVVAGDAPAFADAMRAKHPGLRVLPQADVDLDSATLTRPATSSPARPASR